MTTTGHVRILAAFALIMVSGCTAKQIKNSALTTADFVTSEPVSSAVVSVGRMIKEGNDAARSERVETLNREYEAFLREQEDAQAEDQRSPVFRKPGATD